MKSLNCVNCDAVDEVLFVLETNHVKCHKDGCQIKHNEELIPVELMAEISPWLSNSANEAEV